MLCPASSAASTSKFILSNDLAINRVVMVTFSLYHITVRINHVLYLCNLVVLSSQFWMCGKETRVGVIGGGGGGGGGTGALITICVDTCLPW